LIDANSEPWTNGNAIAKSSSCRPGTRDLVAASSPDTLMPIKMSGNSTGGITIAGWRSVC
jgi:hypothetical protein